MSYIHHFIHLYFFTEFEILFYIYYILPYEKQLVYDMFDVSKIIDKFDDDLVIKLINNISNINTKSGYNGQCDAEQDRIDNSNNKLWTYCFIYIIFINSILCLLFVYDLILNYKLYNETKDHKIIKQSNQINQNNEKKYNSQSALTAFGSGGKLDINYKKTDDISSFEIDMIDLELDLTSISNSPTNIIEKNKCKGVSNSYCIYYWNNSVLVIAMCNTLKFILFIGVFEYLFFVFIINKFKIVNSELLLCKLLKEF